MFEHDAVSHFNQTDEFVSFKSFLLDKPSTFENIKINKFVDLKKFDFVDLKVFFLEKGVVLNDNPMLYKAKKIIHESEEDSALEESLRYESRESIIQKVTKPNFLPLNLVHIG